MMKYAVGLVYALTGCVIPDRNIRVVAGRENLGAVRVVESTPLPEQWSAWCLAAAPKVTDGESFCPTARATRPSGVIMHSDGPNCICPDGQRDARAAESWSIFAEDGGPNSDGSSDTLYGVLLLDPDPFGDPQGSVAYQNYLPPCEPGAQVPAELVDRNADATVFATRVLPSQARNAASPWEFRLDDAQHPNVDLCNDDNGTALPPGEHNLQILVTDRPFFRATRDDVPELMREQCGVPDIAAGATYAVLNYVFTCVDGTQPDTEASCACEDTA